MNQMRASTSFLAALLLVPAIDTPVGTEEVLSNQLKNDNIQLSIETTERTSALRSLAAALSSGSAAMRPFHGLRSEDEENKDRLNPAVPGMVCYIDRILSYVSCYGPAMGTEEADDLFTRLVGELRAALPADRWMGMKRNSFIDSVRSYLYDDQKSDAHIDIDIVAQVGLEGQSIYVVSLFAWTY